MLVDFRYGSREVERCFEEVEGPPAASGDVGVFRFVVEMSGGEVSNATASDVGEGCLHIGEAEVNEAVPTEKQVAVGEWVGEQVELLEAALLAAELGVVPLHDVVHNVAARVVDAREVHVLHPVEVAAGQVEQGAHAQLVQQAGQLGPERGGLLHRGAFAGNGLVGDDVPFAAVVDLLENLGNALAVVLLAGGVVV